jgi:hypothetical protein
VFGRVNLTLRPRKKLSEPERKKLAQHFVDVDLWSFEKGIVLDHVMPPEHLAFKTADGVTIGVYDSGRVDVETENVETSSAPRIEKLAFRVLGNLRRVGRLKTTYGASLLLHSYVKERKLLRFIHACSVSALNPYLKQKMGERVTVQGLLVRLDRGTLVGMTLPNDLDFLATYEVSGRRKGLLRRVMNEATSRVEELGG